MNDLEVARYLADNGVPLFIARPDLDQDGRWIRDGGHNGTGYIFPRGWQRTEANPDVVDKWAPGLALCAVMGHTVDVVDFDPKNGPGLNGQLPRSYGRQDTPSGGTHDLIAPLGVRSRDGIMPGVDIKAGAEDGSGRGFIFLPPTVKLSKATGELGEYRWSAAPDLGPLLLQEDSSGRWLAEEINRSRSQQAVDEIEGPRYEDMDPKDQKHADDHVFGVVEGWKDTLRNALDWTEGERDDRGRGWEGLVKDAAWALACLAATPWTGVDDDSAAELYQEIVPPEMACDAKCRGKWTDKLVEKASIQGDLGEPSWFGLNPVVTEKEKKDLYDPYSLADVHLAERVGRFYLRDRYIAWGRNRWAKWDGRRWDLWITDSEMAGVIGDILVAIYHEEMEKASETYKKDARKAGGDPSLLKIAKDKKDSREKAIRRLLNIGTIKMCMQLSRSVVEKRLSDFDNEKFYLNCGNGIVDLKTGKLSDHDPNMLFTQVTDVDYVPGARHPDWDKALEALPEDSREWMRKRFGQAATGVPTKDDIVPFLQGGGENGKTTVLVGIQKALGGFASMIPDKVISSSNHDHPTEMMTLKGTRLAIVEELPEGDFLNVSRLKRVVGTETMTARLIGQDNVSWEPTHSLMVTTNYQIKVVEVDHGTWRRLALVEFPYTFGGRDANRPKDDTLRDRLRDGEDGQWEAVLAWVVGGAVDVLRDGLERERDMPERVREATWKWRNEANLPVQFIEEALEVSEGQAVRNQDVYLAFCQWHEAGGHRKISNRTFWDRAKQHPIFRASGVKRGYQYAGKWDLDLLSLKPVSTNERMVTGVCFRGDFKASLDPI